MPTTMPLTVQQNELPSAWIDRLFMRFSVMYGRHWSDMWADVPMADIKDAWREGLSGCSGESIRLALKGCGTFPPTLPEFVALCKPSAVPAAHRLYLSAPKTRWNDIDPRVREEIAKFLEPGRKRDPKDWARDLLRREQAGEKLLLVQMEFAREALGLAPLHGV